MWPPAAPHDLEAGSIDVWLLHESLLCGYEAELRDCLSGGERQRAASFVFPADGRRYALFHGALHFLLSSCTGSAPDALEISTDVRGKPALPHSLAFNLSHSGGWMALAVAPVGQIGVDIEVPDREVDVEGVAARFFHPDEAALLSAQSPPERQRHFFRLWTAKEAMLKMTGQGLAGGLDSTLPEGCFMPFALRGGLVGALAARPAPQRVRFRVSAGQTLVD